MQVSVGISNSSENDTTELWSMSASSNETQHPSDDGISMGIATVGAEVRAEQDGNNELAMDVRGLVVRNGYAAFRDDIVLMDFLPRNEVLMEGGEMNGDAGLDVLDFVLVDGMGIDVDREIGPDDIQGRQVILPHDNDIGNGSVFGGDIRDGGAQMSPSFNCEDDSYAFEGLNEVQGNGASSSSESRIQIRPIEGTISNEGPTSTCNTDRGQ